MAKNILINLLMDKPIAYHADIAKAVGSVTAGLFLSQLLYWQGKGADPKGWIYKTQSDWYDETGLTRREQETARKKLKQLKILQEERRGLPAKLYYKIDFDRLIDLLKKYYDDNNKNPETLEKLSMADSAKQECTSCTNKNGGFRHTGLAECDIHTITENTTKNTNNVVVVKDKPNQNLSLVKELQKEVKDATGKTVPIEFVLQIMLNYSLDYIRQKIEVARRSNIGRSVTGFLRKALEEDWLIPEPGQQKKKGIVKKQKHPKDIWPKISKNEQEKMFEALLMS